MYTYLFVDNIEAVVDLCKKTLHLSIYNIIQYAKWHYGETNLG